MLHYIHFEFFFNVIYAYYIDFLVSFCYPTCLSQLTSCYYFYLIALFFSLSCQFSAYEQQAQVYLETDFNGRRKTCTLTLIKYPLTSVHCNYTSSFATFFFPQSYPFIIYDALQIKVTQIFPILKTTLSIQTFVVVESLSSINFTRFVIQVLSDCLNIVIIKYQNTHRLVN